MRQVVAMLRYSIVPWSYWRSLSAMILRGAQKSSAAAIHFLIATYLKTKALWKAWSAVSNSIAGSSSIVANPIFETPAHFARLANDEVPQLKEAIVGEITLSPGHQINCEGARPNGVHLIMDGWCVRHRSLINGRRQIMSLLLPGDILGFETQPFWLTDHSVSTMTHVRLAVFDEARLASMRRCDEDIDRLLTGTVMIEAAIQREKVVSLGQRDAISRLAHLFCELYHRCRTAGICRDEGYQLPLTQADLADVTGMTTVHVNRTLQELRARKLIRLRGKKVKVLDIYRLSALAMFDPGYLHLQNELEEPPVTESAIQTEVKLPVQTAVKRPF